MMYITLLLLSQPQSAHYSPLVVSVVVLLLVAVVDVRPGVLSVGGGVGGGVGLEKFMLAFLSYYLI